MIPLIMLPDGWEEKSHKLIIGLVDQLIEENPQIDESRLYLTGLSLGAYGIMAHYYKPRPGGL